MRILTVLLAILSTQAAMAQTSPADSAAKAKAAAKKKFDYNKLNLKNRANDHFMFQAGYDGWAGKPDSIQTSGFSRHLNVYVMMDMPFKTNPQWSVGIGVGIGSSNMFFEKTDIRLTSTATSKTAAFTNVADTNNFKKYKLTNVWAEAPVELRWMKNPANPNKSLKIAIGAKVGTMISGYTKGKNLQSASGNSVYGNKYTMKVKERAFFNSTRLAGTLRVGYGALSLYGSFQVTGLFKEGAGPEVYPYSVGICIAGL
ncbi:outer membrane beta-barrel protein [Phnomibacter sp. MR]|uniref:outer membrane beta-barrel protein n=1 Tax=Phnomibacter sp. MR TaxID=3042318 RepID=UPI003A7FE735